MDKRELLEKARKDGVFFVQLWFSDLHGKLKRITIVADELEAALYDGVWFDGSSIEGFTRIQESDARLLPDPSTYALIPWAQVQDDQTGEVKKGARIFCDVLKPDGQPFEGDPRYILKRVLAKAREMGFVYNVGPEVEFFLFQPVREGFLPLDQAGYFDATGDLAHGFRDRVMLRLSKMGIPVQMAHHEVAPGQYEIGIRYSNALTMADRVLTLKHVIERTARDIYKLRAVFMPKPIAGINGSGMHTHQSLFDLNGRNLFYDPDDPYQLSQLARNFLAGQIAHIKAMAAIVAPTVNSYKRLVPGYEAPTYICWGRKNRAALIRIPAYTPGREQSTRCELRVSDPSCNPYLAFAVMLAAGLDGIKRKLEIPAPIEEDVFHFTEEDLARYGVEQIPGSLGEALTYLEQDTVLLETLGGHTARKFLEAKKTEWAKYQEFCKGDVQSKKMTITDWEIRKYLYGGFKKEELIIKRVD